MDITNFFQPKGGGAPKKKPPDAKPKKRKKAAKKGANANVPAKQQKTVRVDLSETHVAVDRQRAVGRTPHPFLMPHRSAKKPALSGTGGEEVAQVLEASSMQRLSSAAMTSLNSAAPRFPSVQHVGHHEVPIDEDSHVVMEQRLEFPLKERSRVPAVDVEGESPLSSCMTPVGTIEGTGATRAALKTSASEWTGSVQSALDIYLESYLRLTNEALGREELSAMFACVVRMRDDPSTQHALWPSKYSSMTAEEMEYFLGQPSYEQLHDWITTWNRQMEVDSEDYEEEPETMCSSGCIIVGDLHGFGKTMAVYKTAASLGYSVLEINAGDDRRGRNIDSLFKEASQSHLLADGRRDQQSTMLLFEDADIPMEEDTGFYKSLTGLLMDSRVPVVLTCSNLTEPLRELQRVANLPVFRWDHSRWHRPLLFVQLVLLAQGALTDIFDLFLLFSTENFDVRKTLLALQLRLTKTQPGLRQLAVYEGADDVLSANGLALYGSLFRAMLDSTTGPWLLMDTPAVKRLREETRATMLSHNPVIYSEYYPYLLSGVDVKHTASTLLDCAEAPSFCDLLDGEFADDPLISSITTCVLAKTASIAVSSCDAIASSLGEDGESARVHAMQEQDGLLVKMAARPTLSVRDAFGRIHPEELWYLSRMCALEAERESAWDPEAQMQQQGQSRRTRNSCRFNHYLADHAYSPLQYHLLLSMHNINN